MSRETILIVEDEAIIAGQLQDTLEALGYTTLKPVATGEAAIAAVKAQPPDLVLMDIKLAGAMDGITAAGHIQSAADIPIVYLTGYSQDPQLQQAKATAPYGYLVKPVGERGLAATLEMALYKHVLDRQLRESAEKYRRLVDNANEAILVAQDGRLKFVNRMASELTGYSEQELTSRPFLEFIHPDDRGMVVERHLRRLAGDVSQPRYAFRLMTRDGSIRWVEVGAVLIDWEGRPATLNFISDITERKRAEDALRESEERYRNLIEMSPDALAVHQQGKFVYVNPAGVKLIGAKGPQELVGKPILDIVHPAYRDSIVRRIGQTAKGENAPLAEEKFIKFDGTAIDVEVAAMPFTYQGKAATQVVVRDITARKRAEEALREREQRLTSIYDTVGDVIFQLAVEKDGRYRFASVNRAFLATTGLTSAQVVGKRVNEVIPEPSLSMVLEKYAAAIREKGIVRWEETSEYPTGRLIGEVSIAPVFDEAGNCASLVGAVHDITERKRAEETLGAERRLLRTLMDNIPDTIYFKDAESRFVRNSQAHARKFGLSDPMQMIGKTDFDFFTEEHARAAYKDEQAIMRSGQPLVDKEEKETWPDGRVTWVSTTKMPLHDQAGRIVGTFGISRDITERKRAEEALRESSAQFRTLFEASPDAILLIDPHDRWPILDCNTAACQMNGYTRDELVGQSIDVLNLTPGDSIEGAEYMERIRQSDVLRLETFHRRKDGTVFPVEVSTSLLALGGRDVVLGIDRDITERRRAEALQNAVYHIAQASELVGSLSALLPQIQRIISEVMPAENFYFALYDQARNLLSFPYSIDEVDKTYLGEEIEPGRGLTAYVLRTGKSLLCTESIHEKLVQQGEIELIGVPSLIWLGVPLIVHSKVIGAMVVQHYSNPHAYGEREQRVLEFVSSQVAMAIDRKQAEEALRKSAAQLRAVLDATPFPIALVDVQDNNIEFWSSSAFTLFGHTAPTATEWYQIAYPDPDYRREVIDRWKPALEKARLSAQAVNAGEYRVICRDGSVRICELYVAFHADRLIVTFNDITARKQAEEALRQTLTDLQRSNADLERFAYVASHDLQEPLRMVASFVQLLGERYRGQLDADADEFIGFAVDGAKRMQSLINDLLEYSRVGTRSEPLQATDANGALDDALWNLDLAITDAGATVTHDPLPTVLADPTQLTRLFQNLIGNAIKFRGDASPVVHIAAQLQIDASIPQSAIHDPKSEWVFSVRDNGIGMNPKDHARIFGIFQRLHSRDDYPGTGIGLAVCQRIVERHGGRIWVESQVGQGTTFYFTLPVAE